MTSTVNKKHFFVFLLIAVIGIACWFQWSLPRYTPVKMNINQEESVQRAQKFLHELNLPTEGFNKIAVFDSDDNANRYLQRTLGIKPSKEFVEKHAYELFFWHVRFFKESQKEEYRVIVSSKTGNIISFQHILDDSAKRAFIEEPQAKEQAIDFIKNSLNINPDILILDDTQAKQFDHRRDYRFNFRHDGIYIPWQGDTQSKGAKLITSVTISGDNILSFSRIHLEIPDTFNRYVENLKETGDNLTLLFKVFYLALITIAIIFVVNQKTNLVQRRVKPFYVWIGVIIFALIGINAFNNYHEFLFFYPTSQSMGTYLTRAVIESLIAPFFLAVSFILPCLAGESLAQQLYPQSRHRSILNNLQSSFLNRDTSSLIILGYLTAIIVLGLQSAIFEFGYKYCGVWQELNWLTQSSTAIIPALAALLLALQASLTEETMFRLFGIHLGLKYIKNVFLVIIIAAFVWGFGHTGYAIYPMWFRGLEVGLLGVLLGIIYWRFGLIVTITAHYLMNAFLMSMPYLLNPSNQAYFIQSLIILSLPAFIALIAWGQNKTTVIKPLEYLFNKVEQFNLKILKSLMANKTPQEREQFAQELINNGWDATLVQTAIKNS